METGILTKPTQAERVLEVLRNANGAWVSGRYFLQQLYLSQFHARIFELQNNRDRYAYEGVIESSEFRDEHGFVFYRLVNQGQQKLL